MENKIFILILTVCTIFVNQSFLLEWTQSFEMHCEDGRFCETDVNSSSCPEDAVLMPRSSVDNCCPGCVPLNVGADCKEDETVCGPGLECTTKKVCRKDKYLCPFYGDGISTITVKPTCDEEGKYAAVQCKGEKSTGRCFCYNSDGYRLFGQQWWNRAQNMTCACSRRTDELQKEGRTNVTLHCNEEGNYEELQCDSNICWCAEEKSGRPTSTVVPITMMSLLPCYDAESVGSQYLRRCESVVIATNNIEEEMSAHGTMYGQRPFINCERDGSYGSYQADKISVFCTWKDNTKLGAWQAELSGLSSINCRSCCNGGDFGTLHLRNTKAGTNKVSIIQLNNRGKDRLDITSCVNFCNIMIGDCARDTKYFENAGKDFSLMCMGNGNYVELQPQDNMLFCVDPDGATVSGLLYHNTTFCVNKYYLLPKP